MDNEYLFNLHSTLLTLKKRTDDEIKNSKDLLNDDIVRFKKNKVQKPTLETVNELWNPIKGKIVSNEYADLISIQRDSYPIFEEFVKYVVNTFDDIESIIQIISINLKNMNSFMERKSNDFTFSIKISDSSINDKMIKLVQEVEKREKLVKNVNREVKIGEINKLIQERNKMIDKLVDY